MKHKLITIVCATLLFSGCAAPARTDVAKASVSPSDSSSCTIKGNISKSGVKIYHMKGCESYNDTVISESYGERWFCSPEEAEEAGWRAARNC